jgi:predicted  nucleic acid-binding Zn-ribbon protein
MNGKPMPIFLDDIKELLDPQRVKERMGTLFQLPNLAYKLTRAVGELLKAVMITNEELKKLNEEVEKLHQSVAEIKPQLEDMKRLLEGSVEVEDEQGEEGVRVTGVNI